MDDTLYGTRNKRGHWFPLKTLISPPIYRWPPQPVAVARWLIRWHGYMLPNNAFYALVGVGIWFLMPSMETARTLEVGWISYVLLFNAVLLFLWIGAIHLRLYINRAQGEAFKYNSRWPTENPEFLFGNQTIDNMIWTFASAVPILTAYQVLMLWGFSNGYFWYVSFADHPIYLVALIFVSPFVRTVHFYLFHRLLHAPTLYRLIHKIHHNNSNPGPWSGLAMHPVEHLLFFSSVLFFLVIPSHPIVALMDLYNNALQPAVGHAGFDKVVVGDKEKGEEKAYDLNSYYHYLHHKLFECNYGNPLTPIDEIFGTFHDGSPEAEERMNKRLMERTRRQNARKAKRDMRVPG